MKLRDHILKAEKAIADMIGDGHLATADFETANNITAAQYELKEARNRAEQEPETCER